MWANYKELADSADEVKPPYLHLKSLYCSQPDIEMSETMRRCEANNHAETLEIAAS